jgi:Cu+-exporting ATPase
VKHAESPQGKAVYTCPMHPEVQQEHPGHCPKCGMALELRTLTVAVSEGESGELHDMTRRLWIGSALTLPVFVLAMAHLIPALGNARWVMSDASRWVQFALATPVVLWAGWPFFQRGWRSMVTWNLNMFTLIAIGVGTALATSWQSNKFLDPMTDGAVLPIIHLNGYKISFATRSRNGSAHSQRRPSK